MKNQHQYSKWNNTSRSHCLSKKKQRENHPYRERKVIFSIKIDIGNVEVAIRPHALDRFDERILDWKYKNSSEKTSKKSKELFKLFHRLLEQSEFYAFSAKKNSFVMRSIYNDGINEKEVFFILNFSQIEKRFEVPTVFSWEKYAKKYIQTGRWSVFIQQEKINKEGE